MKNQNSRKRKKEQIILATAELFGSTHDFSKVSIEDIAAKAGVSPTTIYNNFGTRDGLIAETIKYISLKSLEEYEVIIRSDLSFVEKFKRCMLRKVSFAGKLDWDVINRIVMKDPVLSNFAADIQNNENITLLMELIQDGKKQGYISKGLSDESIIMYFQILQASGSEFFKIIDSRKATPDLINELTDIFLYGFMEKGGTDD